MSGQLSLRVGNLFYVLLTQDLNVRFILIYASLLSFRALPKVFFPPSEIRVCKIKVHMNIVFVYIDVSSSY